MKRILVWIAAVVTLAGCSHPGSGSWAPPVAEAGPDQTVDEGEMVALSGTVTVDPNATPFQVWTFESVPPGSTAVLFNAETTTPSFVANAEGDYVLRLAATDGVSTASDTVMISALHVATPVNSRPVANAGGFRTAPLHGPWATHASAVLLNGGGSFDPDGDALEFKWDIVAKPLGSVAEFNDADLASPSLFVDQPGDYDVVLQVSDGIAWSDADHAIVSAAPASVVAIASGDAQYGPVGAQLPMPLGVKVTNEYGDAIDGAGVIFAAIDAGDFFLSGAAATTLDGIAWDHWQLGTVSGPRVATATAVTWVDKLGNATTLAPLVLQAWGKSGPAVDFVTSIPATASVDDGAVLEATGYDLYGNLASDDDTTQVTLRAAGGARFGAAQTGTVLDGADTATTVTRVQGGAIRILVGDHRAETTAIGLTTRVYTATDGPLPLPPAFTGDPSELVTFAFPGAPLAYEDGALTISARGDLGGGRALTIADESLSSFWNVLASAPGCSAAETAETVTLPVGTLLASALDGTIQVVAANLDGFDPNACADNDMTATLSYSGGAARVVRFTPGATASIVLEDPVDGIAPGAILASAWAADQFGNHVWSDNSTRFSLSVAADGASFQTTASDGILIAGGGQKVFLRVLGGLASIEVLDGMREPVLLTLGDAAPSWIDASMTHDCWFTGDAVNVALVSGDAQWGTVARMLGEPLVFEATDDTGRPVPNTAIQFALGQGGAITPNPAMTDRDGRVSVRFSLGSGAGPQSGVATVFGATDATFSATATVEGRASIRVRNGTPAATGNPSATVLVEVLDRFGNVVSTDDATQVSLEANGSAMWASRVQGTAVDGIGSPIALVTVRAGVAELELVDSVSEPVTIVPYDSTGNGMPIASDGGIVPFFASDFEGTTGGASAITLSGTSSWEHGVLGTVAAFSGSEAWATNLTGNYNADELSCLDLPIALPPEAKWSTRVRYDLSFPDAVDFRVCDDSGAFCTVLASRQDANGTWEQFDFDLAGFSGSQRRLQWCLTGHVGGADGIAVDDTTITGRTDNVVVLFP